MTGAVKFVPGPGSLASFWQIAPANYFDVTAPVGSITDVHVTFCVSNEFQVALATIVSGSLGNVYYLALDGPASNLYVPEGLFTTS